MWLALAALLAVAALAWRRRPALSFGLWWILLWLAPTNSVLARLDLANDRQWYLAVAGVGWLLGLGLWQWRQRWPSPARWVVPLLVTALALAMALGTAWRNRVYVDETAFWSDVTRKSPHNGRAWNNLGMALALDCRPLAAADAFGRAASLGGEDWRPRMNLDLLAEGGLPEQPADPACRLRPDPNVPR
jgi:protein O-mannosyl-transferase